MRAARRRETLAFNNAMIVAYTAAVLPYMKRPPRLKDLLRDPGDGPRRRQTWQEMKAALIFALPGPER